ncbi:MAG: hypothetical protein JW822_00495 [Spirochaetales bacterium]|nr:hypothetical protein [Spirochaetales bacterium]
MKIIESVVWGIAESNAIKIKNRISLVLNRAPDFLEVLSLSNLITLYIIAMSKIIGSIMMIVKIIIFVKGLLLEIVRIIC